MSLVATFIKNILMSTGTVECLSLLSYLGQIHAFRAGAGMRMIEFIAVTVVDSESLQPSN
jgi:hypothetical protein